MAMREDEDVAEAVGINLVKTKLLAFAIGAAFSGLSGAIFASRLSSIFPHSFNLLVSINVLCLIIVGGMGSLPGVVVGALVLVGLPELLREFAEYRLMLYGALLIVMMLSRPEGLWPSAIRKRELHAYEEEIPPSGDALAEPEPAA
jgi:branched-chain amino acid transport system permease protein